jgi:hypothetical protein
MPTKQKSTKIPAKVQAELRARAAKVQAELRALAAAQLPMSPEAREYFAKAGAQGGAAGTGEAKRRGGSKFYRELAAKRKQKK